MKARNEPQATLARARRAGCVCLWGMVLCAAPACEGGDAAFDDILVELAGEGNPQALAWLVAAAEGGHADAQDRLARIYLESDAAFANDGNKDESDRSADEWGDFESDQVREGDEALGSDEMGETSAAGDARAKGLRWLARAAARSHAAALATLGSLAREGDPEAQYRLALLYCRGEGVAASVTFAARWFRAAANQGHPRSQYELGLALLAGDGVIRSPIAARDRFREAADSGHAGAQYQLGLLYLRGEGVERDERYAIGWFLEAAIQGHPGAQNNLGQAYATGWGVATSPRDAVRWFRPAAEGGEVTAQYNLGYMYHTGLGTPHNAGEAVRWLREAAERGYPDAQHLLAEAYMANDPVLRYAWLFLAAEQGHEEAEQARANLLARISAAQLRRALELAADVVPATATESRESCRMGTAGWRGRMAG